MGRALPIPKLGSVDSLLNSLKQLQLETNVESNYRRHFLQFTEWLMEKLHIRIDDIDPNRLVSDSAFDLPPAELLEQLILDKDGYYVRLFVKRRAKSLNTGSMRTFCCSLRFAYEHFFKEELCHFRPSRLATPGQDSAFRLDIAEDWIDSLGTSRGRGNTERARLRRYFEFLMFDSGLDFDSMLELRARRVLDNEPGTIAQLNMSRLNGTLTGLVCVDPKERIDRYAAQTNPSDTKNLLTTLRLFYRWLKAKGWSTFDAEEIRNPNATTVRPTGSRRVLPASVIPLAHAPESKPKEPAPENRTVKVKPPKAERAPKPVKEPKPPKEPRPIKARDAVRSPRTKRGSTGVASTKAAPIVEHLEVQVVRRTLNKLLQPEELLRARDSFLTLLLQDSAFDFSFEQLCGLTLRHIGEDGESLLFERPEGAIIYPMKGAVLEQFSAYAALVTNEVDLIRTWEAQGEEAPLLLSLDGGRLVTDESAPSGAFRPQIVRCRSDAITSMVRNDKVSFAIVRQLRRTHLADTFAALRFGRPSNRIVSLCEATTKALRIFATWWTESTPGAHWTDRNNDSPLFPALDGESLTADDSM